MHARRRRSVLLVSFALALASAGCPETSVTEWAPDPPYLEDLERAVFRAVNEERCGRGLEPLRWDAGLSKVARDQSAHLWRLGRLTHRDRRGREAEGRMEAAGIRWELAGENVARNRGFDDPVAEAVRGWLASSGHRRNMLSPRYRETGVGVVQNRESGYYYFTQVFLKRMPD